MDDNIFKRWIDTGQIYQEDIVPIMLEYDHLYNEGKITAQDCLQLLQNTIFPLDLFITNCLKAIAYKKDGQLVELLDVNKNVIKRYWYASNNNK